MQHLIAQAPMARIRCRGVRLVQATSVPVEMLEHIDSENVQLSGD
jgi:hypothetical protein